MKTHFIINMIQIIFCFKVYICFLSVRAIKELFVQIPVFLSKTLADKLFIIQYPAYIKDGCTNATLSKTSIKPENQKIRVELEMDTANKHSYDRNMGKQLALNTDGKSMENDEERMFDR